MYSLNDIGAFKITDPADTYVYEIVPCASGIAAISSDDSLRLLNPLALNGYPLNSVRKVNKEITCLKAVNTAVEGDASVVVTAGRDGRVCLIDLRTGTKVGEVRSGESLRF